MADPATTYDAVPYDRVPFVETHPDRLATLATLFGLEPPPIDRCRVLELGCAHGSNLIPLALTLPGSRFLGIDLSPRQIAEGQQLSADLRLDNIELRPLNILDFGGEHGPFDYIICHGVYSWVPAAVQDRILDICRRQLAPRGIAFISYNTYPGWFPRQMVRDMLVYHTASFADAQEKVREARAFIDYLAAEAVADAASSYTDILRGAATALRDNSDAYLLHEYLEDINEPIYFHQFMDRIRAKNLRYLADARPVATSEADLSPEAIVGLRRYAHDPVRREQCLDFLQRRAFRRSVLCHADVTPRPGALPERVTRLHLASSARAAHGIDLRSEVPQSFVAGDGRACAVAGRLRKESLRLLAEVWPRSLSWDEFRSALHARLSGPEPDETGLAQEMLGLFLNSTLLDLHIQPPPCAAVVGLAPRTSPLARLQARNGPRVTNLRHGVDVLNDFQRQLVQLLDGSRERAELVRLLAARVVDGTIPVRHQGQPIVDTNVATQLVRGALDDNLSWLLRHSLLMRE